jgi:hypothetical protein
MIWADGERSGADSALAFPPTAIWADDGRNDQSWYVQVDHVSFTELWYAVYQQTTAPNTLKQNPRPNSHLLQQYFRSNDQNDRLHRLSRYD